MRDRVFPGDGTADVAGILGAVDAGGYRGWYELEILSDDGRELSGMIKGTKAAHVAKWRLVGPSCLQTASRPD